MSFFSSRIWILCAALLFATACRENAAPAGPGGGKGGGPGGRGGNMKFPVQVETVAARDVEYALTGVGTVEAFEKVQITARVAGVVEKVSFQEGLLVKKGQVLAEIEPARYKLAVDAADAALQKAIAQRDEARAALQRREAVDKESPGLIRGEELETFRTQARSSEAETQAARVALEQAQLNLRDAYVRAPAAGIVETRTVQTGQYVQPGAVLATLVQRDPLLVRFRLAESDTGRLSPKMPVKFKPSDSVKSFDAVITHVGQAADPKTRMVELTAEVTDERRGSLRPGSFASVTVPVATTNAPVIPLTAVRPSEKGFLAYVVDEQNVAHERRVILGMRTADGYVEVKEGVNAGDRLVVRGAEALREGAEVRLEGARQPQRGGAGGRTEAEQKKPDGGGRTATP